MLALVSLRNKMSLHFARYLGAGTACRGVAQLVERLVWDQDVARSNRVTPTKNPAQAGFFLFHYSLFTIH